MNKLEEAFELFDTYNKQDPNKIIWNSISYPLTYFFALQLHDWVIKLNPDAGEALLLASRSQHIGRWTSARTSYPEGKAGYLQWRTDLKKFHAAKSGALMREAGYEEKVIEHTQHIILKKDLRTDQEVQTIENALCLVFLQYQFDEFILKHDEKKVLHVLQKSWGRMTGPGREAALSIVYSDKGKDLLDKSLS